MKGQINTLCLGDLNGIVYNGDIVEPNLNLSYLIKRNCGFYNYYPFKFLPSLSRTEGFFKIEICY